MTRAFLIGVLLTAIGGGCSTSNDASFCESDQDCEDSARPFCDVNGAFEGGAAVCIARPSGGECDGASTSCQNPYPICNTATMQCLACVADAECASVGAQNGVCAIGECVECEVNGDCGLDLPMCADSTCTACPEGGVGDALCKARSEGRDMCVGGLCSECAEDADCNGTTPVCNSGVGICEACVENPQCPSALCDIDTGACVAEANVVYADADNGADGGACGTKGFPCQSIAEALTKIDDQGRDWIKLADGPYEGVLSLDAVVAKIVGDGGAQITPGVGVGEDDHSVVAISGNANVLFRDLAINNAFGQPDIANGVLCAGFGDDPTFRLLRVLVHGNDGTGVSTQSCNVAIEQSEIRENRFQGVSALESDVTIERSEIHRNRHGGIGLSSSSFSITNNFITLNGTAGVGGIQILGQRDGPSVFSFNTLSRNRSSEYAGIDCTTDGRIILSNNVIFNNEEGEAVSTESANCFYVYNCVDQDLGGNNVDATGDFVFVDPLFDFHLIPEDDLVVLGGTNPCIDAADPAATLSIDIDGDMRPQGAGRDIGADELLAP